ncbi:MAG: quinone-dependent dihydroorotate dehydrogenase [Oligoflexia bacterium]|nr:quinone-dependent dihydroorotate dehydrogenase [Oligoflexia bacterium]
MYKNLFRPALFLADAESAHHRALKLGQAFCRGAAGRWLRAACDFSRPELEQQIFGLHFKNPVGLAAGFDKDCVAPDLFSALGFGFLEFGTVTPRGQSGNPRPRIFRLPADAALINRMGFPNQGLERLRERLKQARARHPRAVFGVNFGKSKTTEIDHAAADYLECLEGLGGLADFFVVNVSSPNTPELRRLQEPARLRALLLSLSSKNPENRPILVKLAPDLSPLELRQALECCLQSRIAGVVATNTTLSREGLKTITSEAGGLSGRPLFPKALQRVKEIAQITAGQIPIIGVGGISSGADAIEMMRAGASLVQVYTGLIYEGPFLIRKINQDIFLHMQREGLRHLAELRGRA